MRATISRWLGSAAWLSLAARLGFATSAGTLLAAACVWLAAGTPALAAGPTEAQFKALQAEVRELRDREAIRDLLLEYGHLLDTRDFVGYSNLFARNGEWIGGFGRAKGPKAILALMYKYMGTAPFDPRHVGGFHLLTNMVIHVDGDRATARTKLVFLSRSKADKPVPQMGGHYDDVLIREDGKWKFLRRVVMMDIPFQDPREIKGEPPPTPVSGDASAEQLQRLADRDQILELFADYGSTLDRHDFAAFGDLFAEDATYAGGAGAPVHGRAAIRASLEEITARNPAHLPAPDFHLFFNPSIRVSGDRATAHSTGAYAVPDTKGGGAKIVFLVTYDDVLVRRGGRWLFLERVIHGGIPAASAGAAVSAAPAR